MESCPPFRLRKLRFVRLTPGRPCTFYLVDSIDFSFLTGSSILSLGSFLPNVQQMNGPSFDRRKWMVFNQLGLPLETFRPTRSAFFKAN